MKRMLSLLTLALCLVAVPVLAEKCCGNNKPRPSARTQDTKNDAADKCCGNNKPRPVVRTAETNIDATDKCGCNANKPRPVVRAETEATEKCPCNANKPKSTTKGCNNCGCKPCGGCCGK
jgi:hypothetical protein